MDRKRHWDSVYLAREAEALSWYQAHPGVSLELVEHARAGADPRLVDVGGGASTLVDRLLTRGFTRLSVADVSEVALARGRARLGAAAARVSWRCADVTRDPLGGPFDVWHDRAVFHFLTDPADRARYRDRISVELAPGGYAVIGSFALDGPERCSGLPVARYSPEGLAAALELELVLGRRELHRTPAGAEQPFSWALLERRA